MRVTLAEIALTPRRPLTTAAGTLSERRTLLVSVGHGWGEAAPFPGIDAESVDDVWNAFAQGEPLPPTGAAALDAARFDDEARGLGVTLADHCGATGRPATPSQAIGSGTETDTVRRVAEAVDLGCGSVKLKVVSAGGAGVVAAVVAAFPGVVVGVDANGSLGAIEEALPFEAAGAWYIEQPFAPNALDLHRDLRSRLDRMEVVLDESIRAPEDVSSVVRASAADRVCLKPGRLGIAATLRMADIARDAGVGIKIGGMFDSAVGRAIAAALARLEGSRFDDIAPGGAYFVDDVVATGAGGRGIGFTPDPTHLLIRRAQLDHSPGRGTVAS